MSISPLVRHFEGLGKVPIQLPDVVAEFRRRLPNSTIRVTGVNLPFSVLRGAHYNYVHTPHKDGTLLPVDVTQIIYSVQQPIEWQKLVVCKELIHVFDDTGIETDQPDEVIELVKKLSGELPKTIKSGGLQWFFDELAQYQAMAILFPFGLREAINGKKADPEAIAKKLELPIEAVNFVMADAWKTLRDTIL